MDLADYYTENTSMKDILSYSRVQVFPHCILNSVVISFIISWKIFKFTSPSHILVSCIVSTTRRQQSLTVIESGTANWFEFLSSGCLHHQNYQNHKNCPESSCIFHLHLNQQQGLYPRNSLRIVKAPNICHENIQCILQDLVYLKLQY